MAVASYATKAELAEAKKLLNERITALTNRVSELEKRIGALEAAQPVPPPEPAPGPEPILWGARIDGEPYGRADAPWDTGTWDLFEQHAAKKVSLVHWGQPFGAFDSTAAKTVLGRGALNLISISLPLLSEINSGAKDAAIDTFATACKSFGAPVFLRPGWEMNGGWYAWGRNPEYVSAWRRLVTRVRAIAPNARFVWCPNTVWDVASREWLERSFPGADYVDWLGVDGYNWGTNPYKPDRWKTPAELFDPTLSLLLSLAPGKPVMICETACTESGGSKADWITELLGSYLPSHPEIQALQWFNWNVVENGGHLDWPIESSPAAQAAFAKGIASPHYLAA